MSKYSRSSKPKPFDLGEPTSGPGAYPRTPRLLGAGVKRKNTVKSGPGSQRKGQMYITKRDLEGGYYHVYGRGNKARRVKLRKDVARDYGYPAQS